MIMRELYWSPRPIELTHHDTTNACSCMTLACVRRYYWPRNRGLFSLTAQSTLTRSGQFDCGNWSVGHLKITSPRERGLCWRCPHISHSVPRAANHCTASKSRAHCKTAAGSPKSVRRVLVARRSGFTRGLDSAWKETSAHRPSLSPFDSE